jgi:microcompartment protein CcmK/EutM
VDTIAPNAYTDRVRMVVADSGGAGLGRWVAHERDYSADFRRAFGQEPPPVNGVIVSADTDNTGESVESYFGDIEFRARRTS